MLLVIDGVISHNGTISNQQLLTQRIAHHHTQTQPQYQIRIP